MMNIQMAESILPSQQNIVDMAPVFAEVAQSVYDEWEQDENGEDEELGSGGICHLIAEGIVSAINSAYPNCLARTCTVSSEQHVNVLMATKQGVLEVDVPYRQYESGAGYTWTKLPDVQFCGDMVSFDILEPDVSKIGMFLDDDGSEYVDENGDPEPGSAASVIMAAEIIRNSLKLARDMIAPNNKKAPSPGAAP